MLGSEMRKLFRMFGQQMGMEEVRGLLPESIDMFVNDAVMEKIRAILSENAIVDFKNKVALQNNPLSIINALRTLYTEYDSSQTGFSVDNSKIMLYVGVSVKYSDNNNWKGCRLIDAIELENTLNDYCNSASKEYPIAVFNNSSNKLNVDVYDSKTKINKPHILLKGINYPNKINHSAASASNDYCDIPDYLCNEVVKLAVTNYFKSVGYTSPAIQNNIQN